MTRNVRIAIGVGAIVVVAIVVFVLQRGDSPSAAGAGSGSARPTKIRTSTTRDTDAPQWFGVPAAGGRKITGTVYLDGTPTAATLELASVASDAGVAASTRGAAGADGAFDLGTHRAGTYRLFATAPHAVPRVVPVDCETRDARVEVFLTACKTEVEGDVRDASGGAIAGAAITTGGFTLATTDAAGRYRLCLGSGGATLIARADGYAAAGRAVGETGSGSVELDFDLVPDATAIVTVVDPDHAPVEGALVRAELAVEEADRRDRGGPVAQPALAVTDAQGRVELHGLAPSRYLVTATADGLVTDVGTELDPVPGQVHELTLTLVTAVTIRGKVVDAGATVPDFRLHWRVDEQIVAHAVSGADGTFAMAGVPPGPGEFAADSPSYVTNREYTAVVGAPPVDVEIVRAIVVRGKVVRGPAPVGGADVWFLELGGDRAVSRADGSFEMPMLGGGDLTVEAESDAHGAFGSTRIHVEGNADVNGVVVDVEFGGTINGIVVDQSGTPLPHAAVRYDCSELNDYGAGVARLDGTFTADKLRGGCKYLPTVQHEGGELPAASGAWQAVDVPPNGRVDGVRLVAKVERVTVAGVVVDARGPVADALVQLWPGPRETRSAVDGRFKLTSTNPGPFVVEARASGTRTVRADEVAAGTRDLRLVVQDPGGVHLTCDPTVAHDLRLIGGDRGWQRRTIQCGATVKPIAAGNYTVFGADIATPVEVVSGAIAEVTVAPSGRSEVTISFSGEPAKNVSCHAWWTNNAGNSVFQMTESSQVSDGKTVTLDINRGSNQVECSGDGMAGGEQIEVGDQPMQITIKLYPRGPDDDNGLP